MGFIKVLKHFNEYKPLRQHEFLGKVVKVDVDEDQEIARIKVMIDELFKGISEDDLPWIYQEMSSGLGGTEKGTTSGFCVPIKGSYVKVKFHDEDIYAGTYSQFLMAQKVAQPLMTDKSDGEAPEGNDDGWFKTVTYPHCYGFTDEKKTYLLVNKDEEEGEEEELTNPNEVVIDRGDGEQRDTEKGFLFFKHHTGTNVGVDNKGNVISHSIKGFISVIVEKMVWWWIKGFLSTRVGKYVLLWVQEYVDAQIDKYVKFVVGEYVEGFVTEYVDIRIGEHLEQSMGSYAHMTAQDEFNIKGNPINLN